MKAQRVIGQDGTKTFTVIGEDFMPIVSADRYLRFLVDDGASPHTIRSYATGLAAWFRYLHAVDQRWDAFEPVVFGGFLAWLRTGDLPDAPRVGVPSSKTSASTVQLRSAAVLAFYRWIAATDGLTGPYEALYTPLAKRGRRPYVPMLDGIANRHGDGAQLLYTVRSGPRGRTPVLTPEHVKTILDTCATQQPDGTWTGTAAGLRNRFLFALLAETGMRLGEVLAFAAQRHSPRAWPDARHRHHATAGPPSRRACEVRAPPPGVRR